VSGNTAGVAKRVRPGVRGALALENLDPRFRLFARWGARYGSQRRRELAELHGGAMSAGVGAIVESAAQALAASRFIQLLAGESGNAELFKQRRRWPVPRASTNSPRGNWQRARLR
jgi:hypothetical protein